MMDIQGFISRQLSLWPEAAERFKALEAVQVKTLEIEGEEYRVQFNPSRAVSTAAKVDARSIAARPCFLCAANRPEQQIAERWEDLEILLNPYPVFPGHLVIAAVDHRPQSMLGRTAQMKRLSRYLKGYTIFFNGARCGASAPDHFHFQAVPEEYLSVSGLYYSYTLPDGDRAEELDPMVNMVCHDGVVTVIPRHRHRPSCYGDILVSPAAIDLCGTLITVRREDFDRMDAATAGDIIREVTLDSPPVYVGLVTDGGHTLSTGPDGVHTVSGVTIGRDFHWQQTTCQKFGGEMIEHDGGLINRIGVEEYLCSVISSEMSATSSVELLKAHAVISRSWLLSQLRATRHLAYRGVPTEAPAPEADETVRWYDRDDHTWFDVCSDDHCQRYQGVTRVTSPHVSQAVKATRGMVLTSGGLICDARFSKCCGGAFELFENCWQPLRHPYLQGLADSDRRTPLPDLTVEENARRWILSRPRAYCSDVPAGVLAQVLNDFDRESTPDFYRWTVEYTAEELGELIKRRSGIDFGRITALIPLRRGTSGRIVRLRIEGTLRSMTIGKELLIRKWLSPFHLLSSAFVVETEGDRFILRGAGWGHGVGLCQIGAAAMAAEGFDYRSILLHYFPDTELTELY